MNRPRNVRMIKLEWPQDNQKLHGTRISIKRIVNNTVISLTGQLVTWTSTFFLTIAYGRFLGDIKFGELYFAITFVLLIGIPIERGFDQQITREVAHEPGEALRYLSNTLLIKFVLWLILYIFILFLCWVLSYTAEERILVAICGFTLLSTAISTTFAAMHYSFERVVFSVVATILEKGLSALFGFFLLKNGASVEVMAFVLLGGSLINTAWQAFWFFRLEGMGFVIDQTLIRGLLRTSIPFIIYGMLGVMYYRLDTVLLSLITNSAVVGWYGAGYRLFDTLAFLPSLVIAAIMYPIFSKLSTTSEAKMRLAVEKTMNFLLFCGIPAATVMIVAAPAIIGFLYHRTDFDNTIPVLQTLAPGIVFLYMNSVLGATIVSMKQEKKITIMASVALAFNLGLNLIFIPLYKHIGAAIITSLTEMLLFSIYVTITFPKHLLPLRSLRVGAKILIASLIMALAIWSLRVFNIFVILPVAMIVYLGTATLLRTIPREDLQVLLRAIQFKTSRTSQASLTDTKLQTKQQESLSVEEAGDKTSAGGGITAKEVAL